MSYPSQHLREEWPEHNILQEKEWMEQLEEQLKHQKYCCKSSTKDTITAVEEKEKV